MVFIFKQISCKYPHTGANLQNFIDTIGDKVRYNLARNILVF